jgi:DNA-binding FrmR family transcriptional regulator
MVKVVLFLAIAFVLWILWKKSGSAQTPSNVARSDFEVPVSVTVINEDKDAWEGSFIGEANDPRPLTAHLRFAYTDANDNRTTRSVRVREFDAGSDSGLLIGHCELRNATRTFRQDRISDCVNLDTGEIVAEPRQFLLAAYEASPDRKIEQFENDKNELLDIIAFVARADGAVRKGERAVIAEYCSRHVTDPNVSGEKLVETVLHGEVMTIGQFRLRVGKVSRERSAEERRELLEVARAIVATQKTVHPAEQEAISYLEKKLRVVD